MKTYQLFQSSAPPTSGELFETLLQSSAERLEIERIISSETPEPGVYNQEQDEWVMVLRGRAKLRVLDDVLVLSPGDAVLLPAHTEHEVLETERGTIWLAIHFWQKSPS